MLALPALLVFREGPPPALLEALGAARVLFQNATPSSAAESVSGGWAKVVVAERVPGWQALFSRIESAGGAGVLFGAPLRASESQGMVPAAVEAIDTPLALVPALLRAEARLRQHAEEPPEPSSALLERVRTAERVARFARSIAGQASLDALAAEASARARDLCEGDAARLLLVDPSTGTLRESGAATALNENTFADRVARSATELRIDDQEVLAAARGDVGESDGVRLGSLIASPLLLHGDVLGVLEVVRTHEKARFEEEHLRRLQSLAPHVALAVHNNQMNATLREAQAQLLRSNLELEEKVRERTTQIERSHREWERTFDSISEPLAIQDGFILRRTNRAYAEHAGMALASLPGKTCHEVLAGRSTPCPGCPLLLRGDAPLAGEVSLPGDRVFNFHGFRSPDAAAGDQVVVHYRDVTGEKRLETKLRESERLAALGQLASGAAHEINNPMGFVISNLRSLATTLAELSSATEALDTATRAARAGRLAEVSSALGQVDAAALKELLGDGAEMVEESLTGADRVARIVRGLRELSRLEVDRSSPAQLTSSVERAVRAEFAAAPARVVMDLTATAQVNVSPLHLDQAIGHVLQNAHQAISGSQRVHVRTRDQGAMVLLEVEDEGSGIAKEHLHRVFEPFFTTRGVGGGVGLGLTAAYGIVQRNGGNIEINSEPRRGTLVRIHLPRAAPR